MYKYLENNLSSYKKPINNGTIESLRLQWAKKYLQNLDVDFNDDESSDTQDFDRVMSQARRKITAQKLRASMRNVSLQAWNKTEQLVVKLPAKEESLCSGVPLRYTEQLAPNQLTNPVGFPLGGLKRKYTQKDLKVIGFVSMQFHYTSQMLLQLLSHNEQKLLSNYSKVINDHLYMPLQRAYTAAAKLDCDSLALSAVQHLLPISTDIAKSITQKVVKLCPAYHSYSGNLNHKKVITSSIRDVEMFQVYLWVYADKGNISAIQQELFPLCVMLYPTLKISWEIIRQMLYLLDIVISERLNTEQANTKNAIFSSYEGICFLSKVFGENNCGMELNAYDGGKSCKPLFA